MPTMVTSASDRMAGWREMMSVPMPMSMISAEITMLLLYEASSLRP